jgi:hypothetical protein
MIETWQAAKIRASLQPSLKYLNELQTRMEKAGLHQEKLYQYVCVARKSLYELYIELHYLSCEGGVYRERKKSAQ